MNVTVTFNELLRERNAPETRKRVTLDAIDGFLKEAYRIVSRAPLFDLAPPAD
jgi:syntaxin 18